VLFSEKLGLDLPRKASKTPRKERRYTGPSLVNKNNN